MDTTFMAKPYHDQAGNGMHVHISLERDGHNAFAPDEQGNLSDHLRWAIGGLLEVLPQYMAFLCPNVNSYRRFSPNFYVPCSPTWGIDNRTVAVRVPGGDAENMRIEHRLAGADANPYLLIAALLSAIHYGITNRIEPPPMTEGNAYEQHEPSLPTNLRDALRELEGSAVMKEYIGEEYLDVFVLCKESEMEEFERRSEEHTSELQSRPHLVCRLLLEKKQKPIKAAELFAFTLRVRAGNTDVLTDAEENVRQKLRAEGVM